MRILTRLKLGFCIGIVGSVSAFAQVFTPISTPTGGYTSSTTLVPITAPDGTSVSSITNGTQTITLSTSMSAQTVPSGGWSTWGSPPNTESATPRVLAKFVSLPTQTLSLSVPASTFGVEIEPDTFGDFDITATFMGGSVVIGSVTRTINGSAGALLAAGSSTIPITSVVITSPPGAFGFALAQFRYRAVSGGGSSAAVGAPSLGFTGLCALGIALLAAGSLLSRSRNSTV